MKRFLVLLSAIGIVCLSGCAPHQVSVKDVTKNETIILKKQPGQGAIVDISIAVSGSIAGKGELQLILNGAVYKKEALSGAVSFDWGGDWYEDQAEVRYLAGTASGGSLTLKYEFRDL
ncbi:MAG: hypothetical protein RLY69_22 [Verrucomicrobiota bacterium]|jgi:hypothetical protein